MKRFLAVLLLLLFVACSNNVTRTTAFGRSLHVHVVSKPSDTSVRQATCRMDKVEGELAEGSTKFDVNFSFEGVEAGKKGRKAIWSVTAVVGRTTVSGSIPAPNSPTSDFSAPMFNPIANRVLLNEPGLKTCYLTVISR